jgi:hypothetical protein
MLYSPLALNNLVKTHLRDLEREAHVLRALRSARRARAAADASKAAPAACVDCGRAQRHLGPNARLADRTGAKAGA